MGEVRLVLEELKLWGSCPDAEIKEPYSIDRVLGLLAFYQLSPLRTALFNTDGQWIYRDLPVSQAAPIAQIRKSKEYLISFFKQSPVLELLGTYIAEDLFANVDTLDVRTSRYFFNGYNPEDLTDSATMHGIDAELLMEQGRAHMERYLAVNAETYARIGGESNNPRVQDFLEVALSFKP